MFFFIQIQKSVAVVLTSKEVGEEKKEREKKATFVGVDGCANPESLGSLARFFTADSSRRESIYIVAYTYT